MARLGRVTALALLLNRRRTVRAEERPRKHLIFCGRAIEGMEYAKRMGFVPSSVVMPSERYRVRGLDPRVFEVHVIGTWFQNRRVCEALDQWMIEEGKVCPTERSVRWKRG